MKRFEQSYMNVNRQIDYKTHTKRVELEAQVKKFYDIEAKFELVAYELDREEKEYTITLTNMHKMLGEAQYKPTDLMTALKKEIQIVKTAREVLVK